MRKISERRRPTAGVALIVNARRLTRKHSSHPPDRLHRLTIFQLENILDRIGDDEIETTGTTRRGEMRINRICVETLLLVANFVVGLAMDGENYRRIRAENRDYIDSAGERSLSRQKRYLIFPEGSNVQLVYCLTIGAHARVGELVVGLTAALAWELPSKIDDKSNNLLHRRSRSVIYPKIEAFLQSVGLDGRSCVMRALCETGQRDSNKIGSGTFVQELFHAIFKLQRDGTTFELEDHRDYDHAHEAREDCASLYPNCRYSIYDLDF